jgi:hypothetical protein
MPEILHHYVLVSIKIPHPGCSAATGLSSGPELRERLDP